MGYYINPDNEPKGKVQKLVDLYDAVILPLQPEMFRDVPRDKALICVVDNGLFEAAGLCYCEKEFEVFRAPDTLNRGSRDEGGVTFIDLNPTRQRPRTWLVMEKQLAYKLAGYDGGQDDKEDYEEGFLAR